MNGVCSRLERHKINVPDDVIRRNRADNSHGSELRYSYQQKVVQPLQDKLSASKAGGSETPHWIRKRRKWLSDKVLPLTTAGPGPEGRYYIPPLMVEHYTEMLDLIAEKDRGCQRLLHIQRRYAEKVGRLEAEIRDIKQNERELLGSVIGKDCDA